MIIANRSIAVFALCTLLSDIALARNVALVIGNANYQHEGVLRNPINDARLLSQILKQDLQFDEVKLVENADFRTLNRAVEQFSAMSRGADTAVIYFSGHGQQTEDKQNYLLAVDAKIEYAADLQSSALSSDRLLTSTEGARTRLVILDACRDRPASAYKTRSGTKGLSRARDPSSTGLLVAYATEDGKVALDGTGRNSPYAEALASALKKRDQPILAMLDTVADQVERSTQYQQVPTRSGNLRTNVYLVPPRVVAPPQPQVIERPNPYAAEIAAWNSIKSSSRASDYQSFLRSYPSGLFAEAAQLKFNQLTTPTAPTPSPLRPSTPASSDEQLMSQGMWRDPKTNTIWMRCVFGMQWNGKTCIGNAKRYSDWQVAMQDAANVSFSGHSWRLPHIEELASLRQCPYGFSDKYMRTLPAKAGGVTRYPEYCINPPKSPTRLVMSSSGAQMAESTQRFNPIDSRIFPNSEERQLRPDHDYTHSAYLLSSTLPENSEAQRSGYKQGQKTMYLMDMRPVSHMIDSVGKPLDISALGGKIMIYPQDSSGQEYFILLAKLD